MNIAENILKHNLRNVYFLTGSPCGGKTTMCRVLAEKYGYLFYNSNHRDPEFASWQDLCDKEYQPVSTTEVTDWTHFFNRSTEEYLGWLDDIGIEYSQYVLIELIKLSQTHTVVTDIDLPSHLLHQITTPQRVAAMLTKPELVVRDYYLRDDHRDIYECIMALPNPQQAFDNNRAVLRRLCERAEETARQAGWFRIYRDEDSTVAQSLMLLEAHFGLLAV